MNKIFFYIPLLLVVTANAQTPDDALKFSWFTGNGTARNIATGGVMGSLGGDITAANVNPAGLGLFKTREFVLSGSYVSNNNRASYRGTDTTNKQNVFNYGAIGFIFGKPNKYGNQTGWRSHAFAISVNQLANYNNSIQYNGFNNQTSFSEQYIEELVRDRADTNAALSNYIFGSSLAFRTYLIDTIRGINGSVAGYQSLVDLAAGVTQQYNATTSGGYNEIAIAYAGNMEDKLYIGGTLTIPIIRYHRLLSYSEKDATNNPNNQFGSFTYTETFSSRASGIGGKIGLIYKPKDFWRIGFALHTPQVLSVRDELRSSMTTNTESYAGILTESSNALNSGNPGSRNYTLLTPYRLIASASYVFREVNDTRKQRAFVSADVEYVNYRGTRFMPLEFDEQATVDYLKSVNNAVKDYYKGNINVRLGAELKLHTWMFRVGGGFFGSPYADKQLQANRILASGGIGYRNKGIFIDLGYSHQFVKDVNFAYRLNDVPNTFAQLNNNVGNVLLTFGVKF